jgi:lysozyme
MRFVLRSPGERSMTPVVLDISHHNTVLDFAKVKAAGILGIIHKASQGIRYGDICYQQRRKDAAAAGLDWGAYHFATNDDPLKQVDYFLGHAQPDGQTLLALDWERNPDGPDMSVEQARAFLDELMRQTGRHSSSILVYGGDELKKYIVSPDDCTYFSRFPLWLAEYGPTARLPKAWSSYYLWQYSEAGRIDGMAADGAVDLNVVGTTPPPWEWAPPEHVEIPIGPPPVVEPKRSPVM